MARGEVCTASRCAGTLPAFLGPRAEPLRAVAPERVLGVTLTAPQEKAWAQERAPGYAARRGVACQEGQPTTPQIQGCQCFSMGGSFAPRGHVAMFGVAIRCCRGDVIGGQVVEVRGVPLAHTAWNTPKQRVI